MIKIRDEEGYNYHFADQLGVRSGEIREVYTHWALQSHWTQVFDCLSNQVFPSILCYFI